MTRNCRITWAGLERSWRKKSSQPHLEYHFTIIDSNDINAFATPGGYVYINRGLMAYMTTEAQLAARTCP